MLDVEIGDFHVSIGKGFSASFQRARRVKGGARGHRPPRSRGALPVRPIADCLDRVPAAWSQGVGVLVPVPNGEALWLGFQAAATGPVAVQIGIASTNAVSGKTWEEQLRDDPQNYVVCPEQVALDGVHDGARWVRQFVGAGSDGQAVTMRIRVYEAKPGRFSPKTEGPQRPGPTVLHAADVPRPREPIAVAQGGKIDQAIVPDPYGIDTWDQGNFGEVVVYLAGPDHYRDLTGLEPPRPVTRDDTYTGHRFP